eukprot:TRINITY_DN2894_c0_g2_i1.p1 TRINITY_DN2894_c0_g2~~TRINITY_DN2894_c0_g2_i1.p1  ORF type:complete len:130 (-),score=3.71 TRINITY_DN2894_c0_g2_i1:752-1120(-)
MIKMQEFQQKTGKYSNHEQQYYLKAVYFCTQYLNQQQQIYLKCNTLFDVIRILAYTIFFFNLKLHTLIQQSFFQQKFTNSHHLLIKKSFCWELQILDDQNNIKLLFTSSNQEIFLCRVVNFR